MPGPRSQLRAAEGKSSSDTLEFGCMEQTSLHYRNKKATKLFNLKRINITCEASAGHAWNHQILALGQQDVHPQVGHLRDHHIA